VGGPQPPEVGGVNDGDDGQDETLPAQVQRQNATLQALIDAIGQLVAASRALLMKLQGGNSEEPPGDTKS
jgi:hypothetical protein